MAITVIPSEYVCGYEPRKLIFVHMEIPLKGKYQIKK